ncbi:MAG: hypothetical protein O7G85_14890 [Planctomycetota bacterium]|nr:hypothetical protein [Planctomycetota bacterium]
MVDSISHILQIVEPSSPGEEYCLFKHVASEVKTTTHDLLIVGTSRDGAIARELGMKNVHLLPRSLSGIWPRSYPIKSWIQKREAECGRFDRIQVWSAGGPASRALASLQRPVSHVLYAIPRDPHAAKAFKRIMACEGSRLIAIGDSVVRSLSQADLDLDRVECRKPEVPSLCLDQDRRVEIRQSWGIEDQTLIIGALAEPITQLDAILATKVLVRFLTTGRPVKMILANRVSKRVQAERLMNQLGLSRQLIFDDAMLHPWESAAGLDVAVCFGGSGRVNPWPALWAHAHGARVIAEAVPPLRDMRDTDSSISLVKKGDVNDICRMIILGDENSGQLMREMQSAQ